MPQKLQPRGISAGGPGASGDGLFHSRQTQPVLQQAGEQEKKQAIAGKKQAGQEVVCLVERQSIVWLAEKAGLG